MSSQEVDIQIYKKKREEWLARHNCYLDELAAINKAEHVEIEYTELTEFEDKYDEYRNKFPEKVEMYENLRKELKERYGVYISYFNCPYYCVIHDKKELDELLNINEDSVIGDISNYSYWLRDLNYVGQDLQDECHKDVHGTCLGLAFFIDQDYYLIIDKKTKKERFCLNICPYEKEQSYKIVTNGKDYL